MKQDNAGTIFTVRLKKILLKRNHKLILNYIAGPLLFLLLSGSVYRTIHQQYSWNEIKIIFLNAFNNKNSISLFLLLLLMVMNWTLEAAKWKIIMKPVQAVSLLTACKAVFSGLSFSMFIPTAAGEYVGRTLYMHEGNRLRSLSLNIVGSISQLLVTLVAGAFGLFFLSDVLTEKSASGTALSLLWLNGFLYAVVVAIVVFFLFISGWHLSPGGSKKFRLYKNISSLCRHWKHSVFCN